MIQTATREGSKRRYGWRRRADSNRRITDLQSAALPLGYGAASRAKKIAGAGNGIRTRDPDLGKVVLYH